MLPSHARGYLGLAEWLQGRLAEAERTLASTIARWRAAAERYLAVRGCHHLGQVQRARLLLARGDLAVATPGLGEPLTARELEVLRLLAVGRSNRDIAQELVVTLDTVKKHVGHVLDKLGAANRTQAVARARQLGLLR